VAQGKFREDLFYRINVFPIHLLPLRERRGDIPALALDLMRGARTKIGHGPSKIRQETIDRLTAYSWPGNIREMENVLERCSILCHRDILEVSDLPDEILENQTPHTSETIEIANQPPDGLKPSHTLESARQHSERERIISMLHKCHWNMTDAASQLGIGRSTLYNKLNQYKIEK
jgi:DNA-binding NtrC family response regulator